MEVLALERTLTELDHVRLLTFTRRGWRGDDLSHAGPTLEQLLNACATVPCRQISPHVVTMRSQLVLRDLGTDRYSKLTLSYPTDADPAAGFVSVMSPVGVSLLGQTVGNVARWFNPAGQARAAKVLAILFQPEASGEYLM